MLGKCSALNSTPAPKMLFLCPGEQSQATYLSQRKTVIAPWKCQVSTFRQRILNNDTNNEANRCHGPLGKVFCEDSSPVVLLPKMNNVSTVLEQEQKPDREKAYTRLTSNITPSKASRARKTQRKGLSQVVIGNELAERQPFNQGAGNMQKTV